MCRLFALKFHIKIFNFQNMSADMQTVMSMLRIQSQQIEQLTTRVNQMESMKRQSTSSSSYATKSSSDVVVTLNNMRREQQRMQTLLSAVERQAMSSMDVKDDVAMLQKSDSSHRYDLRLLKTSVGELMSADRSYSLEINQSVSEAKQLLREAFGQQRTFLTRDIAETVKHEVLRIVDEKLKIHLETSASAAAHAADDIIRRDRERERNVQTKITKITRPTRTGRSTRTGSTEGTGSTTFGTRNMRTTTRTSEKRESERDGETSELHAAHEDDDEFDADKVELEMDLLRLEERIREAQRSANAASGARY